MPVVGVLVRVVVGSELFLAREAREDSGPSGPSRNASATRERG
jgi:hypothetical protein